MDMDRRLEMVRMRMEGRTLTEIGDAMDCTRQFVHQELRQVVRYICGRGIPRAEIVYPAIKRAMLEQGKSVHDIEAETGVNKLTIYRCLRGETRRPQRYTLDRIAEALGMTAEEAFADREEAGIR